MKLRYGRSKRRSVWHRAFVEFNMVWITATLLAIGVCQASNVEVNLQDGAVEIIAREAPLIDVLQALAQKAGFDFYSGDPMRDAVTLNLKMGSAESCVRRLVAQRNFALYYKRLEDNRAQLMEIRVFGGDEPMTFNAHPDTSVAPMEQERRVTRAWYRRRFSSTDTLMNQISAERIRTPGEWNMPGSVGIKLTKISQGSVFSQIGIKAGDIISDINGSSIGSSRDFVAALQGVASEKRSIIRIERTNSQGDMDPIYVELD